MENPWWFLYVVYLTIKIHSIYVFDDFYFRGQPTLRSYYSSIRIRQNNNKSENFRIVFGLPFLNIWCPIKFDNPKE